MPPLSLHLYPIYRYGIPVKHLEELTAVEDATDIPKMKFMTPPDYTPLPYIDTDSQWNI